MIKSMTAFGRAENLTNESSYTIEIRCVNKRYCEISARLPQQLAVLEERVKRLVASRIVRGRVDVTIKTKSEFNRAADIEVNIPLARAYYDATCRLRDALGLDQSIGLEPLLGLEGVLISTQPETDPDKSWAALSACILEALDSIDAMRITEGKAICEDMLARLEVVDGGVSRIKLLAPTVAAECYDRLKERITMLTEGRVELDPNRLAQEAAFLADRSDITEEIVRIESHLKQFRKMIESDGGMGRSLDFLLQELNREINTIGSKAANAEISQVVVNLKSELEKIREQVQNIE
jgi:uncharacterized protein (TIGR00255 family)